MSQGNTKANIVVDAGQSLGKLQDVTLFFGADEPNFAYYPHGAELLRQLGSMGHGQTYFRAHHLLTTGDESRDLLGVPGLKWGSTNAYTEDAQGNPIYNFSIIDKIFDVYLKCGIKPYVEVSFMPRALATDSEPYFFDFAPGSGDPVDIFTGWTHPPKSYEKWEALIYNWVLHCVTRYGVEECEQWWWEIWNEPNIAYWKGTREEFFKLHDHAVNGIRRALPTARVGGPDLAGGVGDDNWLGHFIEHCLNGTNYATGEKGTPFDFVSWHAKGQPSRSSEGELYMGIAPQLRETDEALAVVGSYPSLRDMPIVFGEYDPDGCAACLTPTSGYRSSVLYSSFTVASFVRSLDLAATHRVNLRGILTWAFEFEATAMIPGGDDIFTPYRVLTTQGVAKAVLNVHRLFGMMTGGERIAATSDAQLAMADVLANGVRGQSDVGVMASISPDQSRVYALVWHYHDAEGDRHPADVSVKLVNVPAACFKGKRTSIRHFRVDKYHSDAYPAWLEMGSPKRPSKQQMEKLTAASQLVTVQEGSGAVTKGQDESIHVEFSLPVHGVSLLELSAAP